MRFVRSLSIALLALSAPFAATVDLRGVIVDHQDKTPVVGAKVQLKKANLSTVTGNNGSFHITGTTAIVPGSGGSAHAPRWRQGRMLLTAVSHGPAELTVHSLDGRQLGKIHWQAIAGAEYALNPQALLSEKGSMGLFVARVRIGGADHLFRFAGNGAGTGPAFSANLPGIRPLARTAVTAVDTLIVSAAGFDTAWIAVGGYVDTLDTLGLEEPRVLAPGRMLVADGISSQLKVISLATGAVLDSFAIASAGASVYTTEDGRFGFAVQAGVAGKVNVVYSGLSVEPHGDHVDLLTAPPRLLPWEVTGVKPVHFVSHHGYTALFFDGERDTTLVPGQAPSKISLIREADFLKTGGPTVKTHTLSGPQHGVGLAGAPNRLLVTVPDPKFGNFTSSGSTPYGLKIYDTNLVALQDFSDTTQFTRFCRGLHGEAASGDHVLFGCSGTADSGALLLTWNAGISQYASKKIKYPRDGQNRGTGTVKGHEENNFFVGNLGNNHLARFRVASDSLVAADIVDLGAQQAGFEFEREHGDRLIVLTRDGKLHVFDVSNGWTKVKTIDLLAANAWDTGKKAPKLAAGPGRAYVSDPHNGKVHEVDTETGSLIRTLTLPGQPWNLAVFGWYEAFGEEAASH